MCNIVKIQYRPDTEPQAILIVGLCPMDNCHHFSLSGVKSGPSQSTEAVSPLDSTSAAGVPMASEDSTEQLPGDAAGSEVKPDAVESCLLDATEASENEPSRQNSLIESQKVEQEEVEMLPEEMEEDLDLKQQSGVEQENGPEKSSVTDQNKEEENCAQEHSEQKNAGEEEKNEVRNIAKDAAQCSEELVIAKVEDFNSEMAVDVDKAEGRDGRMEVDGSDDAGWCEHFACYKMCPVVITCKHILVVTDIDL